MEALNPRSHRTNYGINYPQIKIFFGVEIMLGIEPQKYP